MPLLDTFASGVAESVLECTLQPGTSALKGAEDVLVNSERPSQMAACTLAVASAAKPDGIVVVASAPSAYVAEELDGIAVAVGTSEQIACASDDGGRNTHQQSPL